MGNSLLSKCQSQYQSQYEICDVCQSNQITHYEYMLSKDSIVYFECENGHIFYVSNKLILEYKLKKQINQLENQLKKLKIHLCELQK